MPRTFQQVIDRARTPLKDATKDRWPDALLMGYANDAILLLRQKRMDLFFGAYASLAGAEYIASNNIPVGDEFLPPIADYVTARVLYGEDESTVQEQAGSFFGLWNG